MKQLFYIVLLCATLVCHAEDFLFNNGSSAYSIVCPTDASPSEQTAARELQKYILQMSGARLPIVQSGKVLTKAIYVGWSPQTGSSRPAFDDQSFTYRTRNGNLYIYGGQERGTMYGVYAFLENELGVRWFTPDCTKVPKLRTKKLGPWNVTQAPDIRYRLDFYYDALRNPEWCAHNRLNENYSLKQNNYGGMTAIYGAHAAYQLVNPDLYFDSHPEYYSLRKGVRQHKTGQLCLSNPDVIRISIQSVLDIIKQHPGYWAYDVSQCDNSNYCQCEKCSKLSQLYGGQSGLMVWYVNQIADAVKRVYPDKHICSLAYLYTRHAPKNIKPRENVVIRLCNIECCFSHPLDDASCERNVSFYKDLQEWSRLTGNIYVWDYVACFRGYLVPYPNFHVLAENISLFARNGVIGILEEGAHNAQWGDFSALRQWLLARLMWDPEQDTDALIREFCATYYGPAFQQVMKYMDLYNSQLRGAHVTYKESPHYKLYTQEAFTSKAEDVLLQAWLDCKGDTVFETRVNRLLSQVYFMQMASYGRNYRQSDAYRKLREHLDVDPTKLAEVYTDYAEILKSLGFT